MRLRSKRRNDTKVFRGIAKQLAENEPSLVRKQLSTVNWGKRKVRCANVGITNIGGKILHSSLSVESRIGSSIRFSLDPAKMNGFIKSMDGDGKVKYYIHPVTRERIMPEEFEERYGDRK